ncbi:phage portal protein [Streptomyces sp. TP-A0875]|uniref:phage portal protein n=1 Tax=Streptomyces sp. TP-A0875 TaxID=552354 RepID=UPI0006B60DA0|nr:phage portal protein [Streptomyces sp. TP-A0875]
MSLPIPGTAWPPPEWSDYYQRIAYDDAWYSGDRERLVHAHRGDPHRPGHTGRTGRLRSFLARGLWGRRSVDHAPGRDRRLHVPLAGDIAATSADLLFSDMPAITCMDTTTGKRLETLLEEGRIQQTLMSGAEQAAALSGVFLRSTWDKEAADRPLFTVVQPDNAIPEWRWGMLRAVTFWEELPGSTTTTVYRRFERHESGRIMHALYIGTPDNVGRPAPLPEHPDTESLASSVGSDGQSVETRIRDLTASYVPNMLPNRLHRADPIGRSDYAAPLYDLFSSLDEAWTSWMRDIRLARSRIVVPDGYLQDQGPGRGANFDEDREAFHGLKIPPNEGAGITLAQFKIRVEEHQRTTDAIMRQATHSAGYSPSSFGLDTKRAITATEVDSKDQRSTITRKKKTGYWRHAVAEQLHVQLQLDAVHFGRGITPERPAIEFGDGVAESEQQRATTLELLHRAGAVSTATRVKILHPEWDDTEVKAEVAAIHAETGYGAADPVGSFPM